MIFRFKRTSPAARAAEAAKLKEQGDALLGQGEFAAAAACYRRAIEAEPDLAKAHCNLAYALKELGQAGDAEKSAQRSLALDSQLADAHYLLATIAAEQGRHGEAEAGYHACIGLAPEFAQAWMAWCAMLIALQRHDEALHAATDGLAQLPDCAELHIFRGNLEFARERYGDAIASFRRALELLPDHPALLGNIGLAMLKAGMGDDAVAALRQAHAAHPEDYDTHCNLGNALEAAGKTEEALACYLAASARQPIGTRAWFHIGNIELGARRYESAARAYEAVLAQDAAHFGALFQLGYLHQELGHVDQTMGYLQRALEVEPNDGGATVNLGICLRKTKRYDEALAMFQAALERGQKQAEALDEIGIVHQELGNFAEAAAWHQRAAQAAQTSAARAQAYNNLGLAYQLQYQLDDAEAAFGQAIAADPQFVDAHTNLGMLYSWSLRNEEALRSFDLALQKDPAAALARDKRATVHLLRGELEQGWRDYEARWLAYEDGPRMESDRPHWLGDADVAGKTVVLYTEQGYGDNLQFVRYASLVAQLGATVWLLAPPALQTLFATVPGVARVFTSTADLPPYDYLCPLMSLPLAFKTTLDTIPAQLPYLNPAQERVALWRERLGPQSALRVGLVWAGNPHTSLPRVAVLDRRRSLHFDQISPLLAVPGLEFHSLQLGRDALAQMRGHAQVSDHSAMLGDFHDTAALIANLDLVIGVDTSVAHLAGAMGKPVWLLNRHNTCWRWLLARSDSPWYPSMRIFRQPAVGDWDNVIAETRAALHEFAQGHRGA